MSTSMPLEILDHSVAPAAPAARPGWLDLTPAQIAEWLAKQDQPAHRARQIRRWFFAGRVTRFEDMSDLPKSLRQKLSEDFSPFSVRVEKHPVAKDQTHKFVLRLKDDRMIECVLIQEDRRATACISTQVGCGMGCVFCASGINGVVRNLSTGEILEQLLLLRNAATITDRLTHIVVMGMGEPLANLENLLEALAIAGSKDGLDIGARHITISTVGLPVKIRRLAELGKQYHLAVSLHAPNDFLRNQIVPTNTHTGIAEILAAADDFFEKTGRQVTYEYVLLGGLNDRKGHARELVQLLRNRQAYVNVIPWNNVEGLPYLRPQEADLSAFLDELRRGGIHVKVRKRKGSEIDAACGQLRRKVEQELLSRSSTNSMA